MIIVEQAALRLASSSCRETATMEASRSPDDLRRLITSGAGHGGRRGLVP